MVKQEVLAALDGARGQYISGQELAARLGVSRTAIWKAVAALRSDGIPIEAVTNRGYTLSKNVDVLNTAAVAALLHEAPLQALHSFFYCLFHFFYMFSMIFNSCWIMTNSVFSFFFY